MSDEALLTAFWSCLSVTVLVLVTAIVLAKMHRVQAHIGAVVGFVVALLVTLVFAELLGQRYDFDATPKTIHLTFAFTTSAALFAPLVTGWRRWKGKGTLGAHKVCVSVFLTLVLCAVSTGVWMLSTRHRAEPRASAGPALHEDRSG